MNLKSKLFGTLAAAAMALSMSGVAIAQQPPITDNRDVPVNVTLVPGVCKITGIGFTVAEANGGLPFGNVEWDATVGDYKVSTGTIVITADVETRDSSGCAIGVTSDGLVGQGGAVGWTINPYYMHVEVLQGGTGGPWPLSQSPSLDYQAGPVEWEFSLADLPNTLPGGLYKGNMTVTISDAA